MSDNFDKYQREFINFEHKPNTILMTSGLAGAGKSSSLAKRISDNIIKGVNPKSIIAITFTNMASRDLKSKIRKFVAGETVPHCSTIHSYFINMLKEAHVKPIIMTEWNALMVLREIIEQSWDFGTKREATDFTRIIANAMAIYNSTYFEEDISEWKVLDYVTDMNISSTQFKEIYIKYNEFKVERNLWDFDDLICDRVWKHVNIETIKSTISEMYVDEYQDLSYNQVYMINKISVGKKLTFIGDAAQKLYGWRQAVGDMILEEDFWADRGYEGINYLSLLRNYRSTENIVKLSNITREFLDDKISESTNENVKGSVKITKMSDDISEGRFISKEIKQLIDSGVKASDISILVRKNSYVKTVIEPAMTSQGISYSIESSRHRKKLWESPITKFLFGLISIFTDRENLLPFLDASSLTDGIGDAYRKGLISAYMNGTIVFTEDPKSRKLANIFNEVVQLSDENISMDKIVIVINKLISITKNNVKPNDISERKIILAQKILTNYSAMIMEQSPEFNIKDIFETIVEDINSFEEDKTNSVRIMTIHGSKGLSLPYVFVCDLSVISHDDDDGFIFYVAITRAEKSLHIVHSDYRIDRRFGRIKSKNNLYFEKTMRKL